MKKISLYIGLNDKDTKTQKIETLEAFKMVSNICTTLLGGATIYNASGIYTHENGAVVNENTLKVELFEPEEKQLMQAVKMIKTALNQEALICTRENIESDFI